MLEVEKTLKEFGDKLQQQATKNLRSVGKGKGSLEKSLDYDLSTGKNSFSLSFDLEDYWEFVDKGVKGVGGTKKNGKRWKLKRTVNTPFKYKNKRPPTKVFDAWSVRKGLAPRKKGRFTKRDSLKYALAESVYRTGIETTFFFTAPFEKLFRKLPDDLAEAYGLDLENTLKMIVK